MSKKNFVETAIGKFGSKGLDKLLLEPIFEELKKILEPIMKEAIDHVSKGQITVH